SPREPRPDQKPQRHGDFCYEKNTLRSVARATRAAPTLFQCGLHVELRRSQCRGKSEENSRKQRNPERKEKHARVNPHLLSARKRVRNETENSLRSPGRYQQSQRPTSQSDQRAFGQKLPQHPSSACAQSGPDREFPSAASGAGEDQIGDVYAGDEQDEADSSEQYEKKWRDLARHALLERHHGDA